MFIRRAYNFAALGAFGPEVKVGARHQHYRQFRVMLAYAPKERLMRRAQVLRRGRIVVVVHHEHALVDGIYVVGHRDFAARRAGEAEVIVVRVQPARHQGVIAVGRLRAAAALGDRRAVEHNRL